MSRTRAFPHVGAPVTVVFLATRVGGTIEAVAADRRRLRIRTDEGEGLTFSLNQATARFTAEGPVSARLLFDV